jgi:AcrR family transcriptional regulator
MARPASDIAERIVHAARERFLNEGVDGASLRQIARDAGTNIGMVYYYYKTKDDLFLAVVEEVYAGILSDVRKLLASELPEEQRLSQLYLRVSRMSEDEFAVMRLILREALISSARLKRVGELFLGGHIPIVLTALQAGSSKGRLRGDLDPLLLMAATLSLGIMPQIVHRLLGASGLAVGELLPDRANLAIIMSNVLLRGIGGPALDHSTLEKISRE